jgi:transposase
MICVDAHGIPLAVSTESANRNEAILIEPLLEQTTLQNRQPERLIYDKAADSDRLRDRLAEKNIDLICPHKKSRVAPAKQDGRKLRRYKRRWLVERAIAWLHNFRRVVTRWVYHDHLYLSFVKLACVFTTLRRFSDCF